MSIERNLGRKGFSGFEPLPSRDELKDVRVDQTVVERNLKKLSDDMWRLLAHESWGGNAMYGLREDLTEKVERGELPPPATANSIVNSQTGEIVIFGNIQDIDPEVIGNPINVKVMFKVLDTEIIDFYPEQTVSRECFAVLHDSVDRYNESKRQRNKTESGS